MRSRFADSFNKQWLLLCEGEADRICFSNILKFMGLMDKFEVYFPGREGDHTGGRSKFGVWLANTQETSTSFRQNIKAVLIASDSDLNYEASFGEVVHSLAKSNRIPVPKAPKTFARKPGQPDVFVMMLPHGSPGSIEHFCIESAYKKWPNLRKPIEDLVLSTGVAGWSKTKQDKMRVQTIVASTCRANPEAGLSGHWRENEEFHIPVGDEAFDEIRETIKLFASTAPF